MKWTRVSITLALCVAALNCGGGDGGRRFLSFGTGGTGGIYYPLGGAIASRLSTQDTVRQYTAEVTGGSVENVNRVATGEMDLGFAIGTTVFEAYHGGADFSAPLSQLRVVAPLYPNVTHVLVPAGSPTRSIAELRGRRVSVGAPGSGTEQLARQLLDVYGISYDDIDVRYLSFRESADALRDRAIDAAIFSVGFPASAVLEAATTGGVRLLPIDSLQRRRLIDGFSYYIPGVIPAMAYPGVDRDVPTVAVMNWIVGTEVLDGDVVTRLLGVLQDDRAQLLQVNEIARQIDLTALQRAPIPLHPAAQRWLDAN